ncbi:uncharacterized protein LOC123501228 [Portunus trituberculatus]|uniref:uncharacterized protein LOC123501228 n=1 Tax=Portunus trituberculatus TaxID=210409 RepID=UPI001E1CFCA0|nr:uncharacterized protein LOC123501228 [Portunus trituberculatus]
MCETFLDDNIPPSYARVRGYSPWIRKDRFTRGGGVAFCYKECVNVQVVESPTNMPSDLEMLFWKIIDSVGRSVLCIGCYRPPSQGAAITDYLTENLDLLLTANQCEGVIIVGDLNPHTVHASFNTLLVVHDLHNHVTFPTHVSGSSLDPVVTDLPPSDVQCSPLDFIGTSDHVAVITKFHFRRQREENLSRTLWKWEATDWGALREDLRRTNWGAERWVPHSSHTTKPSDQPWFGPACREASDDKYRAWKAYKRHPTEGNKRRHRAASLRMRHTQEWASEQWKEDLRRKLRGGQVGTKRWWGIVKDQQGEERGASISSLLQEDGSLAHSAHEKANLLAKHFAGKMSVPDPEKTPPTMPHTIKDTLLEVKTSESEVRKKLLEVDENKATGPDNISPRLLRQCANELVRPLALLFTRCLESGTWPAAWKSSNVVPVHKKGGKNQCKNYRPVSSLEDRSVRVAPEVSARLSVTSSVSDRASCDEDGLRMETVSENP